MSTNVGTLQIEIATNVARIRADMDETKRVVSGAMKDVEQYIGFAKSALVGLIGIGTVNAFKGMILSGIEGKARLYDLSLQTGITVEALGALSKAGKLSHTSIDDIASASNKLSKALFTQNADSAGAASAIKALGLNFDTFKQLAPDQQMLAVAKAMDGFRDGAGKAGGAMELFGKTGATLLPFLKELASKTELVSLQTSESAKQAKEFEDNIIKLKAASESWKREIVNELLPGLSLLTKQMVEAKTIGEKFRVVLGNVFDNAGFSALDRQRKDLENLNLQVGTTSARLSMFLGIQRALPDVMKGLASGGIATQRQELELLTRAAGNASEALKRKADVDSGFGGGPTDTRHFPPKPELKNRDKKKKATAETDDFTPLMKQIDDKIAIDMAELASVRELTEAQKLQAKVISDIDKGYIRLNLSQKVQTDSKLHQLVLLDEEKRARSEQKKWNDELSKQQATGIETAVAELKALQDEGTALRRQSQEYGLSADMLHSLSSARQLDVAAQIEWKAQFNGSTEFLEKQSDVWRKQAQDIRDNVAARDQFAARVARDRNDPFAGADRAVKDYLAEVKRAGDATYGAVANSIKGLEDLTVTALSGGDAKNAARAWVSGILSEVNRLYIVKPLLADILGSAGGAGGSGGGWLGTAISLIGKFFGGGGYSATGGVGYSSGAGISGGRADGGPVSARRDYLVGERGPEILRMGGQAGTVIPNNQIGGGARPVTVNVTNNGQAVQAKSSQRETSEGTVIELVLDAVAADMAGGGKVHDATQRRFGLNPGGTTPRY